LTTFDCYPLVVKGTNLFVGAYHAGVFRSTDNGANWTASGLGSQFPWAFAVKDANLFAGTTGGGAFRSTDNGNSWTAAGLSGLFVSSFAVVGTDLFATTRDAVYRSTNNGDDWVSVSAGIPVGTDVYSIIAVGTNLFVGTATSGVGPFLSTNNGISWTTVNTGLPTNSSPSFFTTMGTNLFLGCYGGGVWKRPLSEMITTQTDGLIAYYPFNGNANDESGNGNNGTNNGATMVVDRFGNASKAYGFNGSNAYIDLPESQSLTSFTDQLTISGWVYMNAYPNSGWATPVVCSGNQNDYFFGIYSDGRLYAHLYLSTGTNGMDGINVVPLNQWTQVTMTYDGVSLKYYVNGILDKTKAVAGTIGGSPQAENIAIGAYLYNGNFTSYFNGSMDDIRIYNRALSNVEVSLLYEASLPIQLGSFIGKKEIGSNCIKLEWSTISEVNNYGFYIERKSEGEENFAEIPNSFIAGHGTTIEMHDYTFIDNTLAATGTYYYRLRQVDNDGLVHYSQAVSINVTALAVNETAPIEFRVHQNYPNPTNPKATIKFSVDKVEHATVIVYDILGKQVAKLFDGVANPGSYYKIEFDGSALSSGIYFYKVATESHSELKKLVLLK
jgi:hypothetical protein